VSIEVLWKELALLEAEDSLLEKQWDALDENGEREAAKLVFDNVKWIIRWDGGQIRLGRKSFRVVQVLYEADEQQITRTDLEEEVWGEITDDVFRVAMYRLERQKLAPCHFPYAIVAEKCQGWVSDDFKRTMQSTDGYKLIPRK